MLHEFSMNGARHPAYNSIVGSGANACILHYVENSAVLKNGNLVLIDAGCELEHYAADITRTFPVSGRFNREQRAIYEIVLEAQTKAIREVKPGNHWNQPHDTTVRIITQGLVDLGLLDGDVAELVELEAYKPFYMHRAGHWLGMDVHDVGDYKVGDEWRVLEPGMVLTVEPGLYVSPDNHAVAKKWRGIGVRIEDDVVVTRGGRRVLTADAPKTVEEIEKVMADRG
jgi:Xaa-Pro aminopeptidase